MAPRRKNNIIPITARKEAPRSAPPRTKPKIGSCVTVTLTDHDGAEFKLSGMLTDQPIRGQMGIVLSDGRFYYGRASAHTLATYRLLINGRILVAPIATTTLIRLDSPRSSAA